MNATVDREKVARIAADVLAELRERGMGGDFGAESPVSFRTGVGTGIGAGVPDRLAGERGSTDVESADIAPADIAATSTGDAARAALGDPSAATLRPEQMGVSPAGKPTLTCNISNRHIHVTPEALEKLFGPGAELRVRNELMQPGQFASEQTVSLIAGRGRAIESVRILGPCRKFTQVEISRTDGFYLGIRPPVRLSGDIQGSAGGTLVGPYGTLVLEEGIIVADRHIHTPPAVAEELGLKNNQFVRVRVFHSDKPALLERVRIRVNAEFVLEMHLDNDDANACGIESGDRLELVL